MLKKYFTMFLMILIVNSGLCITSFASGTKEEKAIKFALKVKSNILEMGIGTNSKIEVKLKDGKKIKGYVSEIKDTSFVVTTNSSNILSEIPYAQVKKAKGISSKTGQRIFVVALLIGIIALVAWSGGND